MASAQQARVQRRIRLVGLPALILLTGLQTLRVFIPSVSWHLKESLGIEISLLASIALGTVLTGLMAPIIRRAVGASTALVLAAGGMAIFRFVEQIVVSPQLDIWLSMAGTSLFSISLPLLISHIRVQSGRLAGQRLAYALLVGITLDSAIRGASWTLDLSWVPGVLPILFVAGVETLMLWLLITETAVRTRAPSGAGWQNAIPLLALGPILFLQAVIFQNQGWISEAGSLLPSSAFLVVMVGNMLAALGAMVSFSRPQSFHPGLGILATGIFIAAAYPWISNPTLALILLALNQFLLGWSLALIGTVSTSIEGDGLLNTGLSSVGALALFFSSGFIYYASLEVHLPFPRAAFPAASGLAIGLILILASLRVRVINVIPRRANYMALPIFLLSVVPLLQMLGQSLLPPSTPLAADTIKVMTYNIHSAFDPEGRQNPEAVAESLERNGAQIIGLQEVSRGWLINGSTDLAAWLANRLGLQMLFEATAGPLWGNALLTNLPVIEHGGMSLPSNGALLDRGLLWARLGAPDGEDLLVIVTHLHHIPSESGVRQRQISSLLELWDGAPNTILMGDLNATPGTGEIRLLKQAGLQDAWTAGEGPGPTYPSTNPKRRIDWIWISPQFKLVEVKVSSSLASDHLPLMAEVRR